MKTKAIIITALTIIRLFSCTGPNGEPAQENADVSKLQTETSETVIADTNIFELPDNTLKTSMGDLNITYSIDGNQLAITGNLGDINANYILLAFGKTDTNKETYELINGTFDIVATIPENQNELSIDLYVGQAEYGNFESILFDFVKIENQQGKWVFADAPVLEENITIYHQSKDLNECLQSTEYIQADNREIAKLSNEITKDCSTEYEKVLKIHDWVAENIYYDYEAFYSGNYQNADALNVLDSKRAVCEGYANLFAALTRAQGIPCRVQNGYALGVGIDRTWTKQNLAVTESNHAWNEAYVDGRWMVIDATWDSDNKIENGQMIQGENINHIYFDSHMRFFSLSHRLME